MQPTYTSPLHGPLPPELHAQLSAQVAILSSFLPHLTFQLAETSTDIANAQSALTRGAEQLATLQPRHQTAQAWLAHMHQTFPSNSRNLTPEQASRLHYWSFELNKLSHTMALNAEATAAQTLRLKAARNAKNLLTRRIEIIAWRAETLAALSDPAAMTSFPLPPSIGGCRDPSHTDPVCRCHIRAAFWLLQKLLPGGCGFDVKAERQMWFAGRFSGCDERMREGFKRMAREVSAVLAGMDGVGWCGREC